MALNLSPKIFDKLHDSPQKSALLIGFGTLALVIALFVFAIIPATSSVVEQYQKNKRRNELVLEQEIKIENLNKLVALEEQYTQEIDLLNENYPIFIDSEYIIKNVQDYLDTNPNLKFLSFNLSSEVDLVPSFTTDALNSQFDQYDIVAVDLDIDYACNIEGSVELLKYLENFPSLIHYTLVSYAHKTEEAESVAANLPFSCAISMIYYTKQLKPEPIPIAVPEPVENTPNPGSSETETEI